MTKPFKADVLVVKLSGKALTADKALDALFTALAGSAASAERTRVVLVHGGGVEVDALMRGLGRRIDRIEGLRVSPAEDMAVVKQEQIKPSKNHRQVSLCQQKVLNENPSHAGDHRSHDPEIDSPR